MLITRVRGSAIKSLGGGVVSISGERSKNDDKAKKRQAHDEINTRCSFLSKPNKSKITKV